MFCPIARSLQPQYCDIYTRASMRQERLYTVECYFFRNVKAAIHNASTPAFIVG